MRLLQLSFTSAAIFAIFLSTLSTASAATIASDNLKCSTPPRCFRQSRAGTPAAFEGNPVPESLCDELKNGLKAEGLEAAGIPRDLHDYWCPKNRSMLHCKCSNDAPSNTAVDELCHDFHLAKWRSPYTRGVSLWHRLLGSWCPANPARGNCECTNKDPAVDAFWKNDWRFSKILDDWRFN